MAVNEEKAFKVRRGRVDSVDLFEIKESELDIFEKGAPAGLQLNFSIFLLSLAFSSVLALATATFRDNRIQTAAIVVAVVGILLGAYLMLAWWRTRESLQLVCRTIRGRIPPEVPAPLPEQPEGELPEDIPPAG